jgi:fructokinase
MKLAAIEAGGTKFRCATGNERGEIDNEIRIPTTTPEQTIRRVIEFFRHPPDALGIASFGPVDLARGVITTTPKREWRNFAFADAIRAHFHVPVGFDTDVNAAALAEHRWGAGQSLRTFLYVTVGTGIGAGAMVEGQILHGRSHPEMGHIRIPHDRARDSFKGSCQYHEDCLEGLASGPAIEARWNIPASQLHNDHPAWLLEADYLALACANWTATFSPERIILAGGVMRAHLFPLIRARANELLNQYIATPEIVPSPLDDRAGLLGALALAHAALV